MTTVSVKASEIWNIQTGDDPGGDLEIFGEVYARRMTFDTGAVQELERRVLFSRGDTGYVSISQGTTYLNPVGAQNLNIESDEWLALTVALMEYDDTSANDPMPGELKIKFSKLQSGRQKIRVNEGNQYVDVVFDVNVL